MPDVKLSTVEYVEAGGGQCPFCLSHEIEGRFIEVNAGTAMQPINCLGCGKRWTDVYELKTYVTE